MDLAGSSDKIFRQNELGLYGVTYVRFCFEHLNGIGGGCSISVSLMLEEYFL